MKTSSFGLSSLLLASAYVAMASTGGVPSASITFSNPVASAGTTPGLKTTVQYYVPTFGHDKSGGGYVGAGGYNSDVGGLATGNPSLTTLSNMESFLSTGSFTVAAAKSNNGLATTFKTASTSQSVTTAGNVLQSNNPDYPGYPLNGIKAGKDPYAYNVDQQGYIDIATAGKYTFTINSADDAVEFYIGGNGTIGSGTPIVADSYDAVFTIPYTNTVDFTAPGLYKFELFYYQGFGGQSLSYTVTPPSGAAAPTYYVSARAG